MPGLFHVKRHRSPQEPKLADLIRRPQLGYRELAAFDPERPDLPDRIAEQVETEIKYEGYIKKQLDQVERMQKLEQTRLEEDLDYSAIQGLLSGG